MKQLISIADLSVQFNSLDFVLKTQRQIAKDFYSSGVQFPENFEVIPASKKNILVEIESGLDEVINSSGLSQLCYQIDISEEIYTTLLNEPDFTKQLSEIILRREAYKVYLRSLF